ncbi:unannotated protein [freshwater metagenome]|uniref:Unannotated protein n=1 Tax=freshwater metagenome TaxID=449393 RepID=A0A6J6N3C6_9ZZZZ
MIEQSLHADADHQKVGEDTCRSFEQAQEFPPLLKAQWLFPLLPEDPFRSGYEEPQQSGNQQCKQGSKQSSALGRCKQLPYRGTYESKTVAG